MTDAPYSADDPAQVKRRSGRAKLAVEQRLKDWRWLLADRRGRRVVWSLLEEAGVFRSSFDPDRAQVTAFHEGQRNAGLRILNAVMQADAEAFVTMQREAKES